MTFARVTDCRKWTNTAHSMRRVRGCQTETLAGKLREACEIATLTGFAAREYDASEMPSGSEGTIVSESGPSVSGDAGGPRARRGRCPTCRQSTAWKDNPQRPFCSLTCRLIDLGVWLDDGYVVPGESPDDVR